MRAFAMVLVLIGIAGIAFGVLQMMHGAYGMTGPLPFRFENYGGPGPLLGGLILILGGLYLGSLKPRQG